MTQNVTERRNDVVSNLVARTRSLLDSGPLARDTLELIRAELDQLAADQDLWSEEDYPAPGASEKQNRFRIGGEKDDGITLYLNVMRPGKKIHPHNHTTWACISAVSGIEHNTLYERTDDGSVPGSATLKEREIVALAPGTSLAMMADDIHSVDIRGADIIRHLHFYGQSLESLTGRQMYDMAAGTYKVMDIGVKSKE